MNVINPNVANYSKQVTQYYLHHCNESNTFVCAIGYFCLHVMDHFLNIPVFFITIIDENSDSHKRCWK